LRLLPTVFCSEIFCPEYIQKNDNSIKFTPHPLLLAAGISLALIIIPKLQTMLSENNVTVTEKQEEASHILSIETRVCNARADEHFHYASACIKLAVLEPEGKGLSKDEVWMLSLVQSSIAADFNKYSSITIIDRQNLEAIIAEQKRSLSAITSDKDAIAIGNLASASHILTGKITKTPKTFMLELAITDVETGKRQSIA